jgi:hypothetical protein
VDDSGAINSIAARYQQRLNSGLDTSTAALNTSTAAPTLRQQPRHFDGGLDISMAASHLDGGLTLRQQPRKPRWRPHNSTAASTSTAASYLNNSLEHVDGGLDTSTFP